jgi:hypothetical protein
VEIVLTFREVADEMGISIGSFHQIFTENFRCVVSVQNPCSHVAPHLQLSGKTSETCCAPSTLFSGLSPSRLFPVSQTENPFLKGHHFQTTKEIQENAIKELQTITKSAFQQWEKQWEWCIASRGNYFEGDSAYNAVKCAINPL